MASTYGYFSGSPPLFVTCLLYGCHQWLIDVVAVVTAFKIKDV